jgi:uncharacterized protein (DUF2147 family)
MGEKMKVAVGALVLASLVAGSSAGFAQDATGTWLNEDKDGIVQITPCGGGLCGKVIWIRDAIDKATGRPPVDGKNADPALRTRPIMGLQVLSDLKPSSTPNRWEGRVYSLDDGKSFNARVTMLGANQIKVEGCVLMVCRGETWTRQAPPGR